MGRRDEESSEKLQGEEVLWREEATSGKMCACLDSEGFLIWGHFLTQRLITGSGLITPRLPVCLCSLEEASFEIRFWFLPSLKRRVNEVAGINGY